MDTRSKLEDKELAQIESFIRETPIEIDLVNRTMNKYESKRNTKQPKNFRTYKKMRKSVMMMTASAAIIFSLAFVTSLISPTMAATIKEVPVLSSVFKLAGDLGLKTADEKGLSTKLHASAIHDDFTLNVSEVVYDGTRVSIGIELLHTEGKFSKEALGERISDIEMFINDTPVKSFGPENSNSIGIFQHPGKDKDSVIVEFSDLSNQGGNPFPEQFDLTVVTTVNGIQEPFKIDIPVKKIEDNLTLQTNVSRNYENIRFTVKKIKLTPVTTNITTQIILTDNSNFTLSPLSMAIGVNIFDDQGNEMKLINGNGWNATDGSNQIMDLRYHPFESVPKTVTIKPYVQLYEENQVGVYQLDENNEPKIQYIPELEITLPINSQK